MKLSHRMSNLNISAVFVALSLSASAAPLELIDGARFDFFLPPAEGVPSSSDGLSGITRIAGDDYLLVSDSAPRLRRLRVPVDAGDGRILSIAPLPDLPLSDERGQPLGAAEFGDREDLAVALDRKTVWVVNERCGGRDRGPCLERFRLTDGQRVALVRPAPDSPLGDFKDMESNRGFESLVADPAGGYWVGLERPLPVDRSTSDPWTGPIRLQHLSDDLRPRPLEQVAFLSDPVQLAVSESEPWQRFYGSRLVALLAPPGESLIAVVSVFQAGPEGYPETRLRFYALDRGAADDLAQPPFAAGLAGREFRPAAKRLVGELRFSDAQSNFEGAALGPRLDNGDWVVLLVRDNDRGGEQSLYSLRLRPSSK